MSLQKRVRIEDMPDKTQPRLRVLVEKSSPDPDRPKINEEAERRLNEVERKTAACYASIEETTFQLHKLGKKLKGE